MRDKDNQIRSRESRTSILVVEDDPEIAGTILEVLVYGGFQVEIAENARRALDLLMRDLHFDLVIANMAMRKIDGLELLGRFYHSRRGFRVIVMKGYATSKNRFQPIQRGRSHRMSNPFNVGLINLVHKALKDHYSFS